MQSSIAARLRIVRALALSGLAGLSSAQEAAPRPAPPGPTGGLTREQMWYAPTAEDWKKPCLLTFQRTWDDALAVSRETQRPILVCVNMDGEIASEHYAGVRYRQPEIALLYEPYVLVIASVYRHNPRDYDENGKRLLCPRFGSVTCGEHIAIEPILFEKFMDGQRVAPRHIAVELDGSEMYDVFYAWDTDSVFQAVRQGMSERATTAPPVVRGDRPIVERVESRDIRDRVAVEQAYDKGDAALRRSLLEAALAQAQAAPTDLVRLGVFGFDLELGALARKALAATQSPDAVGLIGDVLNVPLNESERSALLAALEGVSDQSPRARSLVTVHRGLSTPSSAVDVGGWTQSLQGEASDHSALSVGALSEKLEAKGVAREQMPDDPAAALEFAASCVALARQPSTERRYARVLLDDAERAAQVAAAQGYAHWRLEAILAVVAADQGRQREAHERAAKAMEGMPADAQDPLAVEVLALFARARQRAISNAVREKREWPQQWLTDLHAAYSVLARHPLGTADQVVDHYDFVKWFGAGSQAAEILNAGLARFPDAALLHDRLRTRLLEEQGIAGLEQGYARLVAAEQAAPNVRWFAGYAAIVAAEYHRRRGDPAQAEAAYARAMEHYEAQIQAAPDTREGCDHYIALALAGQARLALEAGLDERALSLLLQSFKRRPQAAGTLDGMNLSPADTSRLLRTHLTETGRTGALAELDAALATLDPKLLELPAYERAVGGGQNRPVRPPGGGRETGGG